VGDLYGGVPDLPGYRLTALLVAQVQPRVSWETCTRFFGGPQVRGTKLTWVRISHDRGPRQRDDRRQGESQPGWGISGFTNNPFAKLQSKDDNKGRS